MSRFAFGTLGSTAILGLLAAAQPLVGQSIVDLGTLPDDIFSRALAINNRGEVVGDSGSLAGDEEEPPDFHAVLWSNGDITDLSLIHI